ncbi:hypothetical protein [Collimonas sp. OK412]|uniref:hypothetical protein n=1 Tax=Collimonas sp. (strain OK412) TaxID=1801619 RepID=UPI0008E6D566|nr:hypothetical protein [Collimonas sp. OK412]SFC62237.1 hypothetical protein SAMN04515619_11080 [Collimonas sp. OK412]
MDKQIIPAFDTEVIQETNQNYPGDLAQKKQVMDNTTLFLDHSIETEITDVTDNLSNADFLQGIFGPCLDTSPPLVVSFAGNPTKAKASAWNATPLQPDTQLPADRNNYFALATFHREESGKINRQKKNFSALHAIMLDDIGGKVDAERITLPPSWRIETSQGNYQFGFILAEPLTDGQQADRLMHAVIAADLCDPGAGGPQSRLARLPVAINGKHTPPFNCSLDEWAPDRRYTVQEIIDGLALDMQSAGRPNKEKAGNAHHQDNDGGDDVLIPKPDENPVITALRSRNLYKAPLGSGKHDITCPWVSEHTGGTDDRTAYFEPSGTWSVGGFKCLHSHGSLYRLRDLLQHLNVSTASARMKATIRLIPGEIHRIVDAAERLLACTGRHYQRGGLIVTVTTDPGTRETRVQDVSASALVRALAGVAIWQRFDARANDWTSCDPQTRHAVILFDSSDYPHLPVLNGLTRQPYLRPDGSLCSEAGFDAPTGMFGVFNTRDFDVPVAPTRQQAVDALAVLDDLLNEFVFAAKSDRSAALSAMLTAVVRPSLPHAPMFHLRAPQISSGKTYLCELITAFATPQYSTPSTFPADDEECRKLLLAELLRAPAVIVFDNLTGDLVPHKSLCTALTSEYMTGRILGVSKTATVNTRALFLSSGNNVGPVSDMTRRCVTINLDPGCETPAARTFMRPDLLREVLANRGRYVSAALTIIRAWIVAECPKTECKPLATYSTWTDYCRQTLLWLTQADPASSVFAGMADDPDRETLGRLLVALHGQFGNAPVMVRDIARRVQDGGPNAEELREVVVDIAGDRDGINRRRLGWWIKRHAGRIVDDKKLVKVTGYKNADTWRIESVISVSAVSSSPKPETVVDTDCEEF